MRHERIVNPTTGRQLRVRSWHIDPKPFLAWTTAHQATARDISWKLLSERASVAEMEATDGGDAAHSNFALHVFENALDWSLGLAVLQVFRACHARGKLPKPFDILTSQGGQIYWRGASGTIRPVFATPDGK
jgi:hypothetical protein